MTIQKKKIFLKNGCVFGQKTKKIEIFTQQKIKSQRIKINPHKNLKFLI
jgi:hypothetical protein